MALSRTQKAHRLAGLVYLLYVLGFLFGITALIGVIINHTCLHRTKGTYAHSHFVWQILSFWLLFAGVAICIILWPAAISSAIALVCLLWWICSTLIGVWYLLKNKPLSFIPL